MEADNGTFKESTSTMVDLGAYIFKDLNIGKIKPEEPFTDTYVKELYESEHAHTATKRLRVILDSKYEKSDLHKVMEAHCQHITMTKHNDILKLLQKFEEFFNGTLGTWQNISSKLRTKRVCKSSMLANILSTEATQENVQKGG